MAKAGTPSSILKVCIMGPAGVGKSVLSLRLTTGRYTGFYDPTIEDVFRKQMVIDGGAYMMELLDTAGESDYKSLRDGYYAEWDVFILVYSVLEHNFRDIEEIFRDLTRAKDPDPPKVVLVGNKVDLIGEGGAVRMVSTEDGVQRAAAMNADFFETSAKTGENVEEMFISACKKAIVTKKITHSKSHCVLL